MVLQTLTRKDEGDIELGNITIAKQKVDITGTKIVLVIFLV